MNKMSYQDAAKTRKKSFISMITEKLVEGNSIGSSIKATVSEKSAARAKGFKEKIDPMNIIKFMTGGSKFAAALYGSARGRSKEDMKYFAGAPRSAKEVGASSTRIDSLETGNEMVSLLMKIYEFMRTTNEEDKTRKEKEANFKEEMEYERGLRHKALLEALSGLKPGKTVTATKETDDGGFGGIFAGLISFVKGLIDTAISGVMAIIGGIKDTLLGLLTILGPLKDLGINVITRFAGFLTSPVGAALILSYGAMKFMEFLREMALQSFKADPEGSKNVPLVRAEREGTTKGVAGQRNRRESVKLFRASEIKDALNAKPAFTDEELVEIYGKPRAELQSFVDNNPNGVLKRFDIPIATPTSQAEAQDLENGASQQPMPAPMVPVNQQPMPAPMVPASNVLNEKTKEMNDVNLPAPAPVMTSQTTNTTNVIGDKKIAPTGPLPSVRNQEPTFANMILYSTRVV
jgi:hypothetical protein